MGQIRKTAAHRAIPQTAHRQAAGYGDNVSVVTRRHTVQRELRETQFITWN